MFLIDHYSAGQSNSEMADQFNVYFGIYVSICFFSVYFHWFGPLFRHHCKVRRNKKPYLVLFLYFVFKNRVVLGCFICEKNEICFVSKVYFLVFGLCICGCENNKTDSKEHGSVTF